MRVYLILLIALFTSCYTKKQAVSKFCTQDSVIIHIHDTITVRDTIKINSDSGAFNFNPQNLTDSLVDIYSDSILSIQARTNKGNIHIKYRTKEKLVPYEKKVAYEKTVKAPCDCPQVCPQTLLERMRDAKWFVVVAFLIGVCVGLYVSFKRSK